ncbi:unnamed protein product [Ambrosiozyma monospora]|uniref:Unnamed protein product n=1 Tax=Ambrosiozyma monospora TaxID=43982 RepID=A0A9W7DKR6_AMBMO|nr:unnamed protein product [Ambrosiozyma monospora]
MPKALKTHYNQNDINNHTHEPRHTESNGNTNSSNSNSKKSISLSMFSCIASTCTSCKSMKRIDCDGKMPSCSNCSSANKTCIYPIESDRRRRKYNGEYIFYLEDKIKILEEFINKWDPELLKALNEDMDDAFKSGSESATRRSSGSDFGFGFGSARQQQLDMNTPYSSHSFNSLLNKISKLQLDTDEEKPRPLPNMTDFSPYLGVSGGRIYSIDVTFKHHLLNLFLTNITDITYVLRWLLPIVAEWDFTNDPSPSHQLLMCSLFGSACAFLQHPLASQMRELFILQANSLTIPACKSDLDEYLIAGLLCLSCYETGVGNDSMALCYNSIACALSQHMGIHISYDQNSKASNFAPECTPLQSAIIWTVCTNDRIVTTTLGVSACIHYKRIVTPFYEVITDPRDTEWHIMESSFSYCAREVVDYS